MTYDYAILITAEPEGGFSVTVPDLPGCFTQGETLLEAEVNAIEAIELWLEEAEASGIPIPTPRPVTLHQVAVTRS